MKENIFNLTLTSFIFNVVSYSVNFRNIFLMSLITQNWFYNRLRYFNVDFSCVSNITTRWCCRIPLIQDKLPWRPCKEIRIWKTSWSTCSLPTCQRRGGGGAGVDCLRWFDLAVGAHLLPITFSIHVWNKNIRHHLSLPTGWSVIWPLILIFVMVFLNKIHLSLKKILYWSIFHKIHLSHWCWRHGVPILHKRLLW